MANKLSEAELVEIWKTMVEVQLHFSQMEMTTRNIFVTIVIALIAGIGFAIKEGIVLVIGQNFSAGSLLALVGVFVTWLFYFVDRYWYHRFLVGTGEAAGPLEKYLSSISPVPIELGAKIGARSPIKAHLWMPLRWLTTLIINDEPRLIDGSLKSPYVHQGRLHSEAKISVFYKTIMAMFVAMAVIAHFSSVDARASGSADSPSSSRA